ncbi:mite allergen Der f 3-like [Amblyomma americanum]
MVARGMKFAWNTGLLVLFACLCFQGRCYDLNGSGCGTYGARGKIAGGTNEKKSDLPWTVDIHASFATAKGKVERYRCGGSIISSRFVLTAARCVLKKKDEMASTIKVYYKDAVSGTGPSIVVADTQIHPNFDRKTRLHNIAVLRLMSPIPISQDARPVCLMKKKMRLKDKLATVSGWGYGRSLQSRKVKIIAFKTCMQRLPEVKSREVFRNGTLICTSGQYRGPCKGDGGGPVTIVTNGRVTQVGVISFPYSCSYGKVMPSAHTRVDNYYAWIESVISYYNRWDRNAVSGVKKTAGFTQHPSNIPRMKLTAGIQDVSSQEKEKHQSLSS